MEHLNEETIIIGKEPGAGRLLVAIIGNEQTLTVGSKGSVPNSVSRCKPLEHTAHASITIDTKGIMTLSNMKSQNVTYVNGIEIATKNIDLDSIIELGKDKYRVDIKKVVECAKRLIADNENPGNTVKSEASPNGKFDISSLEQVWNDYQSGLRKLREGQKKINLIRSGCGIFTMCAMPCIFFLGPIGYALTGVGIAGNIYSFVGLKNDKTTEEQERLTEEFQDNYICPKCNKFLGNISYRLLKKQYSMHCPYCKCEFEEI